MEAHPDPSTALSPPAVVLRLRIIYLAMAAGVALLAGAAAVLARHGAAAGGLDGGPLAGGLGLLVLGTLAAAALAADRVLWGTRVARLRGRLPSVHGAGAPGKMPVEILRGFQEASIVRAALIEAPSLLAAVLYLIGGKEVFLPAVGAGLALFVVALPSSERLRRFAERVGGTS